jgi:hypothetical protein
MTQQNRLFKNIIEYVLLILIGVFIISLLFVPLTYFSLYGKKVLALGLLLLVLSIIMDLFYFAKDTSKRKWGKSKKTDTRKIFGIKRKTFISIIEFAGILVLFLLILQFKKGSIGSKQCPDLIQGNEDASFKIKYFYSPFCFTCWKEEPILRNMLNKHGDSFLLERYDIRYCDAEVNQYKIMGTPTFVFIIGNKEFPKHGFISEEQLEKIIMDKKLENK